MTYFSIFDPEAWCKCSQQEVLVLCPQVSTKLVFLYNFLTSQRQWETSIFNLIIFLTLMSGIPCSMQRAVINFLYMGSSQFSAKIQSRACLLSSAWDACLTPLKCKIQIRNKYSREALKKLGFEDIVHRIGRVPYLNNVWNGDLVHLTIVKLA